MVFDFNFKMIKHLFSSIFINPYYNILTSNNHLKILCNLNVLKYVENKYIN